MLYILSKYKDILFTLLLLLAVLVTTYALYNNSVEKRISEAVLKDRLGRIREDTNKDLQKVYKDTEKLLKDIDDKNYTNDTIKPNTDYYLFRLHTN